jgi:putative Mg2+ transporter-C (MgtC) family protein
MTTLDFITAIATALVAGLIIGLERQIRHHSAGLRTNALVCVGAALFVSASRLVGTDQNPTHIAAQIVSGIGFLGGGVILREGLTIHGMSTAATLWCSAAIGMLAGFGFVVPAAIGTATILGANLVLRPVVRRLEIWSNDVRDVDSQYRVSTICLKQDEKVIRAILMRHIAIEPLMTIQQISITHIPQADSVRVNADIFSLQRNDPYLNDLVTLLSLESGITEVSWQKLS